MGDFAMAIGVRNPEAEDAVRKLAAKLGDSLSEAIRIAAINRVKRASVIKEPLAVRIKKIQDLVASYKKTGLRADKAFFDELSGDQ